MGMFSPSWKTTLGGLISSLGGILMQVSDPPWMHQLGGVFLALGPTIIGCSARDDCNSSEKVGAVKPPAA